MKLFPVIILRHCLHTVFTSKTKKCSKVFAGKHFETDFGGVFTFVFTNLGQKRDKVFAGKHFVQLLDEKRDKVFAGKHFC